MEEGNSSPGLSISPPLLNSASPWATSLEDLQALYCCPFTGAVTTRTTLVNGFEHDDALHQYAFFSPSSCLPSPRDGSASTEHGASLNTLGYSPHPLSVYLSFIKSIHDSLPTASPPATKNKKPIIISVTGLPDDILKCYHSIADFQPSVPLIPLAMEINLSCPNIPSLPPPAYDSKSLAVYLSQLPPNPRIPLGLKTPPYTHAPQFQALVDALAQDVAQGAKSKVSFLTATNTLGSCLILEEDGSNRLPGPTGIGGMAGPPLHPLALGNVRTTKHMLQDRPELRHIKVIGVGGVADREGFKRMKGVGAYAVAVATALGREGIEVFSKIAGGLETAEDS